MPEDTKTIELAPDSSNAVITGLVVSLLVMVGTVAVTALLVLVVLAVLVTT